VAHGSATGVVFGSMNIATANAPSMILLTQQRLPMSLLVRLPCAREATAGNPVVRQQPSPRSRAGQRRRAARGGIVWDTEEVKRALLGSIVLHGVLGAALLSVELTEGSIVTNQPISIEIVSPPAIAPLPAAPPPTDVHGGGSFISHAGAPSTRRTSSPPRQARRAQPTPMRVADLVDYSIDRSGTDAANGGGIDRDGDGGEGNGRGGHRGDGLGFGDGSKIVLAQDLTMPPPPAAKPVSKARPAKLIYPSRERDLGEEALFVARVTVDTDGYVVGAKLVRGRSGPRDDEAADLIFRFRYAPALDDAGLAIKSTFDQPFHVNR
jgi:hypothetical protein